MWDWVSRNLSYNQFDATLSTTHMHSSEKLLLASQEGKDTEVIRCIPMFHFVGFSHVIVKASGDHGYVVTSLGVLWPFLHCSRCTITSSANAEEQDYLEDCGSSYNILGHVGADRVCVCLMSKVEGRTPSQSSLKAFICFHWSVTGNTLM
jgi:hypothetical protein